MLATTEFALLRRIASEQAMNRAPSLVAAVVRDGEIIWSGSRGKVGEAPADNDTQYRIGSITKSMVAALVMRLRDEGKLALNDKLETHVPGTAHGMLTIAELLSHTSGLTAESPGPWWERTAGGGWNELTTCLTPAEAKHRQGSRFHYSNVGYGLLGELVGRSRGKHWLEVLRSELFGPLAMARTTEQPEGRHASGFAVHPFADVLLPEPAHDAGAMAPAGQLWSTVTDLATWTAFVGGRGAEVLDQDTITEMRSVATVDDGDSWTAGYGLGFQLVRHNGKRLTGHTGSMPGFLACNMIDPATQTGALAMTNTTSGVGILGLVIDLISIVDDHEPVLPTEWRPRSVDQALLSLTGLWHWGPTPFILRALGDGWLHIAPANNAGRSSRFRPLGTDSWIGLDGYYAGETLRVGRTADGTPRYLDVATFVFSRTPYDPAAPIPGGVDEQGWR